MKKEYDYLIVGAGLYGACMAFKLRREGKRCLVIDRRQHTGGNLYCEQRDDIQVHKYGAHIFHTSNSRVWQFVNKLAPFNRYTNSPIANYRGQLYNLPFNMNTFRQIWGVTTPAEAEQVISRQRAEALARFAQAHPEAMADGTYHARNLEEQALLLVGRDIYERLIKEYTEKQWGRPCSELPAFIIRRLPVRLTYDNNYFDDLYQGIPIGGYNRLTAALLEGVETRTDADFFDDRDHWESLADNIFFTGKIDQYFGYRFGRLEYRTVCFEEERLDTANYQGNAVMNFTSLDVPYTRIIEHKHFERFGQDVYSLPHTIISREYSTEWRPGMEPYYPVNDQRNQRLYQQYRDMARQDGNAPVVSFGGRLAEYKYYDMAPIVERVLFSDKT
ncbi:MAG: UDP-galactopyranose mutase [Prevotella sp.]|nr:UDP-galactopyranose mutase [Prevotella sp.]